MTPETSPLELFAVKIMVEAIKMPKADLLEKKRAGRRLVEQEFTWEIVAEKTKQGIAGVLQQNAT